MSKGINWQPKVGQEVVFLVDGYQVKEGDVKTVLATKQHCCVTLVDVGLTCPIYFESKCRTHGTPLVFLPGSKLFVESKVLAPIQYSDITASLAKQACEERVEVDIKQVERVVNN